jgi:hypothetical protein
MLGLGDVDGLGDPEGAGHPEDPGVAQVLYMPLANTVMKRDWTCETEPVAPAPL